MKNLPSFFSARMQQQLGGDLDAFLKALEKKPLTSVHLNRTKQQISLFPEAEQVPWCEEGKYLPERISFVADPLWHSGVYYVQEASSMFLSHVLKHLKLDNSFTKALDLCAAPGGKTTHLLTALGADSLVVANEVIKSRVGILQENLLKWGYPNYVVTNNDPAGFEQLQEYFDLVLVDAPCSGEGLFRKSPASISEWSENNVELCAGRQKRILSDVVPTVKAGGYLIYSTCTYSEQENEQNLKWLAENHAFKPVQIPFEKKWGIVETETQLGGEIIYGYRFYPHKVKSEGLFLTCLQKTGASAQALQKKGKSRKSKAEQLTRMHREVVAPYLKHPEHFDFIINDNEVYAIPKAVFDDFLMLNATLNVRQFGVHMGKLIKNKLLPAHALAMSICLSDHLPSVDLSVEEAILYLKKENWPLPVKETSKGWMLAKYKGNTIGWMKNLGNRFNNYYPKEWKIRKDIRLMSRSE